MDKSLVIISRCDDFKKQFKNSKDIAPRIKEYENFEEFKKISKKSFGEIGFILFDLDSSSDEYELSLSNFEELMKDKDISPRNFPPLIYMISEYKINLLELTVLDTKYPKFLGIFHKTPKTAVKNNKERDDLAGLIKKYILAEPSDTELITIGSKCVMKIDKNYTRLDSVKNFFRDRKYSSLFIGKNRYEMLKLRNILLNPQKDFNKLTDNKAFEFYNIGKDGIRKVDEESKTPIYFKYLRNEDKNFIEAFSKDNNPWQGFSVLIQGDTGTGKTLVTEWISRFVKTICGDTDEKLEIQALNCANLQASLFESELFGHLRGSASDLADNFGAIIRSTGKVLFLDEIGELDFSQNQAKLLKYLDNFTFSPGGYYGPELFVPNIVVAATNADVTDKTKFRPDLLNRFHARINLVPLAKRKEDLDILIDYVLQNPDINPIDEEAEAKGEVLINMVKHISKEAYDMLMRHDFATGNFRELQDVLREACNAAIYENSNVIRHGHLKFP